MRPCSLHTWRAQDGYLHVLEGPCAGYELSVTRALGHKGLEACGVLQEPFATMLHLEDKHCCLVRGGSASRRDARVES